VKRPHAKGVLVTTGGWAYCQQVRALARRSRLTLLCGRFPTDGYIGPGLRTHRHLDWGNGAYLRALAREAGMLHERVGGELLLVGVSYSGFGVATLASHHPELRPDRLIVIDSYLDLAARRAAAGTGAIGREIDVETGGSKAALEQRSVRIDGLAELVAAGTRLQVIWSIAPDEAREFKGATCNLTANAAVLQRLANALGKPVPGWVTTNRHGHDLWDHGRGILRGELPGKRVSFRPGGSVPPWAVC
jgi:pimeloyl-ACP methyl ester carboxylesterase